MLLPIAMAACQPRYETKLSFHAPDMSDQQWARLDTECRYEAKKATAAAKPGPVRAMDEEEVYILCLEAKGVKFNGKVRVPA